MMENAKFENSLMVQKALAFATAAHAAVGQKRKYSGDDYIVHPIRVASGLINNVPWATEEMVAAALLHDTVEDTGVTIETITSVFGDEVAELVGWLTDVSKPEDGNRAIRKSIDRDHSARAPGCAQTVKVCDLIDNTIDISAHDKNFARIYLKEKKALLNVLLDADPEVLKLAWEVLEAASKAVYK